jgi:hypothetical protein
MHCSDSVLTFYTLYIFRRMYVIIRELSVMCPAELYFRHVQFVLYVKGCLHLVAVVSKTLKYQQ